MGDVDDYDGVDVCVVVVVVASCCFVVVED